MFQGLIDINNLPTFDLHGESPEIARIYINDFINDNIKIKNNVIAIVHGKGSGKLKEATHDVLKNNKDVIEYKTWYFNEGVTLVKINTL